MAKKIDLKGQKFGKLLVLRRAENKGKNTAWVCRCDCGNEKDILTYNLTAMKSKSCGCVRGKKLGNFSRTHGQSHTRLYSVYKGIKQRCLNKNNPAYKYYGGKGVVIDEGWLKDFLVFKDWAYKHNYKEGKGLSIDRIDPNGNYSPENCRWVSLSKQQNNKLNSFFITIDNEKLTVAEWAQKKGMHHQSLYSRIYRLFESLDVINSENIELEIKTRKSNTDFLKQN